MHEKLIQTNLEQTTNNEAPKGAFSLEEEILTIAILTEPGDDYFSTIVAPSMGQKRQRKRTVERHRTHISHRRRRH